jgi:transketolase
MKAARKAFTETLLELAKEDPTIFALATDSRGSVTLNDFVDTLPDQFVECGIAEQDAVGIAAGLSNLGLRPFVCGPASFYATRAAEQIKVDVAYSRSNVKVIGVSGGVSYGALGGTHHAIQDIALFRAVPNMTVILPADANQAAAMTRVLAKNDDPTYVRMGRGGVPDIYGPDVNFEVGKAIWLKEGKDAAVIACGEMVYYANEAAKILEAEGISISVLDMHTVKPLDEEAVLKAAQTGAVVTVEEHIIRGGLGGAVAEVICQNHSVKMKILGLPDETVYSGTSAEVFDHYHLNAEGIANAVRKLLKG